jgi:transcriptional regulator NrdR family protein
MICNKCGSNQLAITNTRNYDWGVKRVRVCLACGHHMPTIEANKITDEIIKSLERSKKMTRSRQRKDKTNEHENVRHSLHKKSVL